MGKIYDIHGNELTNDNTQEVPWEDVDQTAFAKQLAEENMKLNQAIEVAHTIVLMLVSEACEQLERNDLFFSQDYLEEIVNSGLQFALSKQEDPCGLKITLVEKEAVADVEADPLPEL